MFACFTLAFVIAIGRVATGGGLAWSTLAGVAAGLAVATKETSVIVLPAALAACAISRWSLGPDRSRTAAAGGRWGSGGRRGPDRGDRGRGALLLVVSRRPRRRPRAAPCGRHLPRSRRGPRDHAHPWHFYLGILAYSSSGGLTWTEGVVLALAAVGAAVGMGPAASERPARSCVEGFWTRFLTCNAVIATAIFSAIPYKTPWNLLPFYVGVIVVAGIGFSTIVQAIVVPRGAWGADGSARDRVRPPRVAGMARVGDLRVRPAQSLRLRADRPRRRPHGHAHPRVGRLASRRRPHAGVGHRAAARAVAAALVSPDDAARRLLDGSGATRWPCRRPSSLPRRTRPTSSTAPSATATCRSSSASGPRCS